VLGLLLAAGLLAASSSEDLPGHLLPAPAAVVPRAGATCFGSVTNLGYDNIPGGSGKPTTVVNIWAIERESDSSIVGYVAKTFNGSLWYEPPLTGLGYERIDDIAGSILESQRIKFVGCFCMISRIFDSFCPYEVIDARNHRFADHIACALCHRDRADRRGGLRRGSQGASGASRGHPHVFTGTIGLVIVFLWPSKRLASIDAEPS
jgi:hypothetical protein